jgi:CHAD domain-containing protein
VHDLRVAIRRCRSFAAIMEEVDADPAWPAMQKGPRRLFRALGALRDLQVLEQWVRKLASDDDPVRPGMLDVLVGRQAKPRDRMLREVHAFDQNAWKRLARRLARRGRLVPPDSLTARCLVLERFEELRGLHARAVRTESPKPWHTLRIALKRYRYAVESLLPALSAVWDEDLAQVQGMLGGIHDLDVLKDWIAQEWEDGAGTGASSASLRRAIEAERQSCIEQYRRRTTGPAGLFHTWHTGLNAGTSIAEVTAARLRTTARAMDPHPRRTAEVSRLAVRIFDSLGAAGGRARFRDQRLRLILGTAARLHAIRAGGSHTARHKAARDFLQAAPVPLDWTADEWNLVAEIVRYHRGAEPATKHKGFRRLSRAGRDRIRALAGVLRLARGLRRAGATVTSGIRADETSVCVRLHAGNVDDTAANAARLAAAKHLLETCLGRPILIEPLRARRLPATPGNAESPRVR